MLIIDKETKQINLTRGDYGVLEITATDENDQPYTFNAGDIVRFKVLKAKEYDCVEFQKDVNVLEECTAVNLELSRKDTRIGEFINKPKDFWYEIEVNPETAPQTILGWDLDGPKIFRLYPEGATQDDR